MKKTLLALGASALLVTSLSARDQIRITGSSTVFPFSSYVAEEFGAVTGHRTPVVESTGSGGGMKIFCAGNGLNTPDFTNASRAMKPTEFEMCQENGVKNIVGLKIGFDGIAIAQSNKNPAMDLKLEDIFLALAQEVPSKDGKSLIKNPYKYWNEVNPNLPKREIKMIGAPTTSGTRDSFDGMVMATASKSFPVYGGKKYKKIRTDGAYIPGGENDNLIVAKLVQDTDAVGYFGYSFLEENHDKLVGATLNGVKPTPKTIASGEYPVSRSMFTYMKKDHVGKVEGMQQFINMFASNMMIGQNGVLKSIGLIPQPQEQLKKSQEAVKNQKLLTKEMVKNKKAF